MKLIFLQLFGLVLVYNVFADDNTVVLTCPKNSAFGGFSGTDPFFSGPVTAICNDQGKKVCLGACEARVRTSGDVVTANCGKGRSIIQNATIVVSNGQAKRLSINCCDIQPSKNPVTKTVSGDRILNCGTDSGMREVTLQNAGQGKPTKATAECVSLK